MSRTRALAPVYLSVFLYVAGSSALQVLVPVYLGRHAHFGPAAIGGIVSAYAIASLAARLPVGLAYSAKLGGVFLVAGGALSAAAFALVPFVHGSLAFTLLMVVNGVGWSIATTAQLAVLVARPPGGASTAAAMGWFSGATGLGNAVAGVMGGGLADWVGLRTTFLALAVTPLLGTLLMGRQIRLAAELGAERPAHERRPSVIHAVARMPIPVWIGVLVMFFINGLNALSNTFHPLLALGAGLSLTQIGALSSIRSWASSSSRFGSGPIFSRFDAANLTMPLVIVGTLSVALIPSVIGSFLLQVPLFALAGLSRGLLRVTGSADAFDAVGDDDRTRGMTSAFLYGGLDLGKIVLPVVGGAIAGAWGIANMFRVVPVGLLAVYLLLMAASTRASAPSSARS